MRLMTRFNTGRIVVFLLVSTLVAQFLAPLEARAAGGTFPASPFNGLQISYDVSGGTLGAPTDSEGFTMSRAHGTGTLSPGTLTISGTARAGNGWGAKLSVSVSVDGDTKTHSASCTNADFPWSHPFSVSVAVPEGAKAGRFSIAITGDYNAGTRSVVVSGNFAGAPAAAAATPTPASNQRMLVRASPLLLPVDGASQSQVRFTWLEGDKPVAGKAINFEKRGEGTLDKASAVTDADGNATVTLKAPAPGDKVGPSVVVVGKGQGGPQAEIEISLGSVGVRDLSLLSLANRGGDHLALAATVQSYHGSELRDVPVEFYDGNPASGGKLLGKHTIARLPANGRATSATRAQDLIVWEMGLKAEKKKLYVRIPEVAGIDAKGRMPLFERSFTISNYGTSFKTNADAYSFENPSSEASTAFNLEDALAVVLMNSKLSTGLRVLSYPKLLEEAKAADELLGQGHCLGMSNTVVSYFINPAAKPKAGEVFAYSLDDPAVRGNIILQQEYQSSSRYRALRPWQGSREPDVARMVDLVGLVQGKFSAGQPVALSMGSPDGGHAVVAYQMATVEEFGANRLFLYDSNHPFAGLNQGLAPVALLWPAMESFKYEAYNKVGLHPTLTLPADAGAAFIELTQQLAGESLAELIGGSVKYRLLSFRGPFEPVLTAADGKRLGFVAGQKVEEIPGATVAKFHDAYIFKVPASLKINVKGGATGDGTVTIGAATPPLDMGAAPGGPALAGLGTSPLAAVEFGSRLLEAASSLSAAPAGQLAIAFYEKVKVSKGAALELTADGSKVTLSVGGKSIAPTAKETLDGAALGATTGSGTGQAARPTANPTWNDPLDGKADSGAATYSVPREGNKPAANVTAWEPGSSGQAARLGSMDAYVGYPGSRLRADQGTILVRYKPIPNLAATYAQRQPNWTDFGQYKPPASGFLIDTIGWNGAPKGSFGLTVNPAVGGSLTFGVWDGSKWHNVVWTVPKDWQWDPNRWYEVGVTWGPKGLAILVDGEQKASIPDVVPINNTLPWFLGQAPSYWPYGPHSLLGSYDDLRVYGEQLAPYAGTPASGGAATGQTATGGAGGATTSAAAPKLPALLGGNPPPADYTPSPFESISAGARPGQSTRPGAGSGGVPSGAGAAGQAKNAPEVVKVFDDVAASLPGGAQGALGSAVREFGSANVADQLPGGAAGPVAGAVENLPGGTGLLCSLPLLAGGALLALIFALLGFAGGRRRSGRQEVVARVRESPAPSAIAASTASGGFCPQCGNPVKEGQRHCRKCGASLE